MTTKCHESFGCKKQERIMFKEGGTTMCGKWLCKIESRMNIRCSTRSLLLQLIFFAVIALGCLPAAEVSAVVVSHKTTKQQLQRQFVALGDYFHETFEVDVTGDGRPEIFVGFACGNMNCEYLCFKNNGDGTYRYAGRLGLKIGFFEISDTSHNGFNDIIMFCHRSDASISRIRYEVRDNEYNLVESTEVKTGDIPPANAVSMVRLNW